MNVSREDLYLATVHSAPVPTPTSAVRGRPRAGLPGALQSRQGSEAQQAAQQLLPAGQHHRRPGTQCTQPTGVASGQTGSTQSRSSAFRATHSFIIPLFCMESPRYS